MLNKVTAENFFVNKDEIAQIQRARHSRAIRIKLEESFPRKCNCCNEEYTSLTDFLLRTESLNNDVLANPFKDDKSYYYNRNCKCGTTITIGLEDDQKNVKELVSLFKLLDESLPPATVLIGVPG